MANSKLRNAFNRRLTNPNQKEGIREPLYDTLTYDSASTTSLLFFQVGVSGSKTLAETNMEVGSQLGAGNKHIVEAIEIQVLPGSNASSYVRQDPVKTGTALAAPNFANDVWALMSNGWLDFKIGSSKSYLRAPLLCFPSFTGLAISSAAAVENTNTTVVNQITMDVARIVGRPFVVNPTLPLEAQTPFSVSLNWPSAVTLPSGFDARIQVLLHGIRFRD